MRISVVIPAFNNQPLLDRSLATLGAQKTQLHEVIVVDDGSSPPITMPWWVTGLRITRFPMHRTSSVAKNLGASRASGDFLLFCDSDILHMPDAVESLSRCMKIWIRENEFGDRVLLNVCRVGLPRDYPKRRMDSMDGLLRACRVEDLLTDEHLTKPFLWFEQNCGLVSRRFFEELGGYDETSLPSWGFNNQDLCLRVALARGHVSSSIPRRNGKRLHCFHLWHENHCDKEQANKEFIAKWGEPFSMQLFTRTYARAHGHHGAGQPGHATHAAGSDKA